MNAAHSFETTHNLELTESQIHLGIMRDVLWPIIMDFGRDLAASALGGCITQEIIFHCHVKLWGRCSLHETALRMLLCTLELPKGAEPPRLVELLFGELTEAELALKEAIREGISEQFADLSDREPDFSRLNLEIHDDDSLTFRNPNCPSVALEQMEGRDFEDLVARLLTAMGLETRMTKASGDGGVDIIATSREHITGGLFVVQCKRQEGNIGEPVLRDLFGAVHHFRASKGILITNSSFTHQAYAFAEGKPIELIDGNKLHSLLIKYGVMA